MDNPIWARISSVAMCMVCNNEKVETSVSQFQNTEREKKYISFKLVFNTTLARTIYGSSV